MLKINNNPLPDPWAMSLGWQPPAALKVTAAWRGLNGEQLQQVLAPTAGPFTLTCHDPKLNAQRGFPAKLTHFKAQPASGGLFWDCECTLEETV